MPAKLVAKEPAPVLSKIPENAQILQHFSFESQESLKNWEEKTFKGKTVYNVLREDGVGFLNCVSQDASSGLYVKTEQPVDPNLFISWRWRAKKFPTKKKPEELSGKKEDDFAARVYLIFPGSNFFKSDVIEYIWDEKNPVGTSASSAFSGRIKLLVIESGQNQTDGGWKQEERNIYEDYRLLFGKDPTRDLGVVAIMSDSDNTGTSSEADFAEFFLKLKFDNAVRPLKEVREQ